MSEVRASDVDDTRVRKLEAMLRADGVTAKVSCVGSTRDIAVVHGGTPTVLAPYRDRARDLGFRFLTVDLATLPGAGD
jgi:hypothetical protein